MSLSKNQSLVTFVFLLSFCCLSLAKGTLVYRGYEVDDEGAQFDAYVVRPANIGKTILEGVGDNQESKGHLLANALEATWLARKASEFVRAQSIELSHLNEFTQADYNLELYQLENGHWPFIVITERNNPEKVICTLIFAIQWQVTTLPVFDRFFGRHTELPRSLGEQTFKILDPQDTSYRLFLPTQKGVAEFNALSHILKYYPWVGGGETELKFYLKDKAFNKSLAHVMQAMVLIHELHRWSGIPVMKSLREQQQSYLTNPKNKQYAESILEALENQAGPTARSPLGRAFYHGIRRSLGEADIQNTVMNSTIYAQVSGPSRGPNKETVARRQYIRALNFPEKPLWSFEEQSPGAGTDNIHTDIFSLNLLDYELGMTSAILQPEETYSLATTYISKTSVRQKTGAYPIVGANCAQIMSHWFGRAHKYSSEYFHTHFHSSPPTH